MVVKQTSGNSLRSTLADMACGRLFPSPLHRPYHGTADDVEILWRKLVKNLPLGMLVTWLPYGKFDLTRAGLVRIGPHLVPSDPHFKTGVILDGHSRLSTLAWSLSSREARERIARMAAVGEIDLPESERTLWLSGNTLVADAKERRVRFASDAELASSERRTLPIASFNGNFWDAIKEAGLSDDDADWIYEAPYSGLYSGSHTRTEIERATPEEALEAFRLLCRDGAPMDKADYAAATTFAILQEPTPSPR